MLKKLASLSNPDYLTHDSEAIKVEWESGKVALMTLWASRSGTLLDDEVMVVNSLKLELLNQISIMQKVWLH